MILFITRLSPNAGGHGGSQRAMNLLRCLAGHDTVDLLIIHREGDRDAMNFPSEQILPYVRSCARIVLPEFADPRYRWSWLPEKFGRVFGSITGYSEEVPRLSRRTLRHLAHALPASNYEMIFAGRLPSAIVASQLVEAGLITSSKKFVDLDDIMSRFKERQFAAWKGKAGLVRRWMRRTDIARIEVAELYTLRKWNAASVCAEEDAEILRARYAGARVHVLPNVIDKPRLATNLSPLPRILFVGSLASAPNTEGLRLFMAEAWPLIRSAVPGAALNVVGMFPLPGLKDELTAAGAQLHANVPSVEPFYRNCDIVIAPIPFGGGTRIKILEAMAYGRAVVSTTIGAEGLQIEHGHHALIADGMDDFAAAVVRLCNDDKLRSAISDAANTLQQRLFGPETFKRSMDAMINGAKNHTE